MTVMGCPRRRCCGCCAMRARSCPLITNVNAVTLSNAGRLRSIELALAEAEQLLGHPVIDDAVVDPGTGEVMPVLTIVTDNGGPFRSFRSEAFIAAHPELRHVRTRVRTPGQNGSRERGFGSMKYEWLFREEIDHGLSLVEQINDYRADYNHVRPHEAIAWNRPADVHAGRADPTIPNFEIEETLPTT
jgi:putative transposase